MPMTPTEAREALVRCEPRMPLGDVRNWAKRYSSGVDDDKIIDAIAPNVRQRGHFLRREFLDTYAWKTTRTIGKAKKYSEAEIADVTGVAFRQTDEKLRICLLRTLDGVDWPVLVGVRGLLPRARQEGPGECARTRQGAVGVLRGQSAEGDTLTPGFSLGFSSVRSTVPARRCRSWRPSFPAGSAPPGNANPARPRR